MRILPKPGRQAELVGFCRQAATAWKVRLSLVPATQQSNVGMRQGQVFNWSRTSAPFSILSEDCPDIVRSSVTFEGYQWRSMQSLPKTSGGCVWLFI